MAQVQESNSPAILAGPTPVDVSSQDLAILAKPANVSSEELALIHGEFSGSHEKMQAFTVDQTGIDVRAISGALPVGTPLVPNADLNLRSGPSTSNSIITVMPLGVPVLLQQSNATNGFYNVKYGSTIGWASGAFLNRILVASVWGGPVLQHLQWFANAACSATGEWRVGTRAGHHPTQNRAVDITASSQIDVWPVSFDLGDRLAKVALNNLARYRIWYVIWRQRINYGGGWIGMEDRGSIRENHYDHVHVSVWE